MPGRLQATGSLNPPARWRERVSEGMDRVCHDETEVILSLSLSSFYYIRLRPDEIDDDDDCVLNTSRPPLARNRVLPAQPGGARVDPATGCWCVRYGLVQ